MEIAPGQIITFRLTDEELLPDQTITATVRCVHRVGGEASVYLDADGVFVYNPEDPGGYSFLTSSSYIWVCDGVCRGIHGEFRKPDGTLFGGGFDGEIQEIV
jgi:hypothetical protein